MPTPVAQEGGEGQNPGDRGKKLHLEIHRLNHIPTPTRAAEAPNLGSNKKAWPRSLIEYAMYPTPVRRDARSFKGAQHMESWTGAEGLAETVATQEQTRSGALNPTWVEWLMGFPLGWTDLEDSGTP